MVGSRPSPPVTDRDAERRLARVLRGRGGQLTRADAQVLTALPADRVERTLGEMLAAYRSHLAATDTGELLYSFDPALTRRDATPLGERLARAAAVLWRGFTVAFKVGIVAVLAIYVLVFLALLIALMVARLSGRGDDRDDRDGGGLPLGLLFWVLPWDPVGPGTGAAPRRLRPRERRKKLYQQVFDFVFGPPRPRPEPGAADREALAYIRAHRGRITAAELVALQGVDLTRAEEEATRLMCAHGGEPEVTDDGVVVYVFRDLRLTAGGGGPARWTYAWERLEPRPRLTGNRPGADALIAIVNGFNLVAPVLFVPQAIATLGLTGDAAVLWLQAVPLAFSATFFAVPLGRALRRALGERGRLRRNRRRLILREAFGGAGAARELRAGAAGRPLAPAAVARALGGGDPVEDAAVRRELDALVGPLGADVVIDEGGAPWRLAFPRFETELRAVERVRAAAPAGEAEPGAVVFDSAAPLEAGDAAPEEPGDEPRPRLPAPSPWRLPS
ncbi:MAG TPA: hypothetical protein VGQ83_07465 [Polyangia bacterium]